MALLQSANHVTLAQMKLATDLLAMHIDRAPEYDKYRDYEEGRHEYPYASNAFLSKYKWITRQARLNACYLVRSNFTDRVQLKAWSGDGKTTAEALAQQTGLDEVLDLAVNEAFRCGDAYVLVWPDAQGERRAWYHRADQFVTVPDAENPSEVAYASKLWVDGAGFARLNIYYPDRLERFVSANKHYGRLDSVTNWELYTADGDPGIITHDFGRVPVVHIPFDAQTQGGLGRSVLRDVIPAQDAMNHAAHALIVQTEQFVQPLRFILGYQPEVRINPNTGDLEQKNLVVDETRNKVLALGASSIEGSVVTPSVTQLDPPSPTGLLDLKREWFTNIANLAGIPVTDIVPDVGNVPSGAALRILASKRTATVRNFTKTLTKRMNIIMELLGVPNAYPEWVDPAPVDETELLANAQARRDLGYPLAEVLAELGESPDDIARILEGNTAEVAGLAAAGRQLLEQPQVMGNAE